jgi:hypothetical protein
MEEEERRCIVPPMRKMNHFYKPLVGKPKEEDHSKNIVMVTD